MSSKGYSYLLLDNKRYSLHVNFYMQAIALII